MFSLELPHRGDSSEYTQHAIINIKRKSHLIIPNIIVSAEMGFFSMGLKNEFETAVVNKPSVFEPLKFCIFHNVHDYLFPWPIKSYQLAVTHTMPPAPTYTLW